MKKLISVVLALLMLAGCVQIALAAEAPNGMVYPTIYIRGKTDKLYNNIGTADEWELSDSSRVFSKEVTDIKTYATDKAKELLPEFGIAMVTDNYDAWADKMSAMLEPIYRDFVLDKQGKARPNSGVKFDYNTPRALASNDHDYMASGTVYGFPYDWRLSPLDVADQLKTYIAAVCRVSGKDKVNLVSRCEGCCVSLSYFYKYGDENKIANNVMLGSSALGVVYASNIFAGKFDLNADALNRYVGLNFATGSKDSFGDDLFGDAVIRTFLRETIMLLSVTHATDKPTEKVIGLIDKLAPMVAPGLLMSSYGTCPSYWAMVRDDDYEDAKKFAGLTGNAEWADFVAKIDEYHYHVQKKAPELLKALQAKGVQTGILVKYGGENLPIIKDCNEVSDNTTLAKDASFGATTAKVNAPFPAEYIASRPAGMVSPDGLIDASTALFPETTWYIKYFPHAWWGGKVKDFAEQYLRSGGTLRVGDPGAMPRFQVYNDKDGTLKEMTDDNANSQSNYYKTNKLSALFSFLAAFIPFLRRIFDLVKARLAK